MNILTWRHAVLQMFILIVGGYFLTCNLGYGATDNPRNRIEYYIETYGKVSANQNPQIARAYRVFEQVRAVADRNSKRRPKLVVVNSNSVGTPWAIALPTGHIVLSSQAVTIIHRQTTAVEAEARLAFILGHELAHLANDDFWHQEIYQFINQLSSEQRRVADSPPSGQINERELAADDKGYIYAAMAGYPVELLLEPRSNAADFFEFWIQQTDNRIQQSSHPSNKARTALLRKRLKEVLKRIVFFKFGVRLSHFGYCDDAIYFLREFQELFPGREVLTNLGFCYLQMAQNEMVADRAYFYWMPLLLDAETRASTFVSRSDVSLKTLKQAAVGHSEGYLQEAIEYLQQASTSDTGYIAAKLNLAVAYLYLGKPHRARAVLAEAKQLAPNDLTILILESVALYEQSDAELDLWPTAVAKLEKLAAKSKTPVATLYNLARLLDIRPRPREARVYWNRLARKSAQLPRPIRTMICRKQSEIPLQTCMRIVSKSNLQPPWKWPLSIKGLGPLSSQVKQAHLSGWDSIEFDWFKDKLHGHIYIHPDKKKEILEMNLFVQMQVLKENNLGSVKSLKAYCPRPLHRRELAQGVVWSCDDWAALTLGDRVNEVWRIAK